MNHNVQTFAWSSINVTVQDRQNKKDKRILDNAAGLVKAGELLALMGPSGSGKSTLLDALAQRVTNAKGTTTGEVLLNGSKTTWSSR